MIKSAKFGVLESKAVFKSFDEYSYQYVNNIVYILITKFDDFGFQVQA